MATYAQIKALHNAGSPPNTDFQRASETFAAYFARMAAGGFPPDINDGESDADYEARLKTYAPAPKFYNISASWSSVAAHESGTQVNADSASYVKGAGVKGVVTSSLSATSATTATTATFASSASWVSASALITSASHALYADNAGTTATNAYTSSYVTGSQVDLNITNTANTALTVRGTAGFGADIRMTTSGYGVYASALLTEAVAGVQTGTLTNDLNRGVISAYRDVTPDSGYDSKIAVLTVEDHKVTGSAPLITALTNGVKQFEVDKTGSIFTSGSIFVQGDRKFMYLMDEDGTMRTLHCSASTLVVN